MKIYTPEKFDQFCKNQSEEGPNFLYVGELNSSPWQVLPENQYPRPKAEEEVIKWATSLGIDLLVMGPKSDLEAFAEMYKDTGNGKGALCIDEYLFKMIEPALEYQGAIQSDRIEVRGWLGQIDSTVEETKKLLRQNLLDKATKSGADYVVIINEEVIPRKPNCQGIFTGELFKIADR